MSASTPDAGTPGAYTPEADVRAYAITRGRAESGVALDFETMVSATPMATGADLRFERARVVREVLDEPCSVAELSARLRLPLGVVRVLAGDLVQERLLDAHRTVGDVADDVVLIRRLIEGIRAL
jgi:hypothetical protein